MNAAHCLPLQHRSRPFQTAKVKQDESFAIRMADNILEAAVMQSDCTCSRST